MAELEISPYQPVLKLPCHAVSETDGRRLIQTQIVKLALQNLQDLY